MADPGQVDPFAVLLLGTLLPALIAASIHLWLARMLLAREFGSGPPLWLRWAGLYLFILFAGWVISGALMLAMMSAPVGGFSLTYGAVAVGSLAAIATFPILVRAFLAAAGASEPQLGAVFSGAFEEGRMAYLWFGLVALLFPALMVFAFSNLLGPGNEANALFGNLVQSAITSIGSLLQLLLALVAARALHPSTGSEAEVFA